MYGIGINYMFGLSALYIIIQIALAYRLIYMRKHKDKYINKIEK